MENMELNEVITNDVVENATEALTSSKNGVKAGLMIGGAMVVGAVLWERVAKPIGRKLCAKIAQKKAASAKKTHNVIEIEDMENIEVPDIE